MSLVDELARLEEMRARGTLSEDEFQRAKARLIDAQAGAAGRRGHQPAAPQPQRQVAGRRLCRHWPGQRHRCLDLAPDVRAAVHVRRHRAVAYLLLWIFVPLE